MRGRRCAAGEVKLLTEPTRRSSFIELDEAHKLDRPAGGNVPTGSHRPPPGPVACRTELA